MFETEAAAKAGKTRLVAARKMNNRYYAIADSIVFRGQIEKTELVRNLMSGKEVTQSVDTPLCRDVSSEMYRSM